jgi:peptide/nickel transport system substrate-binding protein
MFNTRKPPTDDLRVRRALIMAIDRAAIVKAVFGDYSPVASGPLAAAGEPLLSIGADVRYDPDGASQLLDQAGWNVASDGMRHNDGSALTLNVVVPTWGSNPEVGQLIEAGWEKLGASVELSVAPGFGQLKELQSEDQYNLIGYYTFGTDPDLLRAFFHSRGAYNWTGVDDPELDRVLDQASQTINDPVTRRMLYEQAAATIEDQALILPMRDYVDLIGYNRRVQGLRYNFQGWFPLLIDLRLAP